jgi:hypothetical protein
MKCPECNSRITQTEYDSAFEWYECKSCEGCFTYAEILEGGVEEETNGKVRDDLTKVKVVAKGKKRRTEIAEDEERAEEMIEEIVSKPRKAADANLHRHRDEASTVDVCTVMGAEIQDVYAELGYSLDEANAYDKALILWREMHAAGAVAREHEVPHAACSEHA